MKLSHRSSQPAPSRASVLLLAVAFALPLTLAGCGSGSGPSGSTSTGDIPVTMTQTTLANPPAGFTVTFREWPVPVASNEPTNPPAGSWPDDVDVDSQGTIWFAQHHSNQIGSLRSVNGSWLYNGYFVATLTPEMDSIAVDNTRRYVWVTENQGNKMARLDLTQSPPQLTEFNAASADDPTPVPGDVRVDSTGIPWITEGYEDTAGVPGRIASINPTTGAITSYAPRTNAGGFDGINFGPDGSVWFVELVDNKVGRFKNGLFTEWDLPHLNVIPTNVVVDPQGMVWVTEQGSGALAELDPTITTGNPWREFPVPTPNSLASGIARDAAGNIWFTEFGASKIGVLLAGSSSILDFPIPTAGSGPEDIIASNGHVYFTEQYGNKVGEIILSHP